MRHGAWIKFAFASLVAGLIGTTLGVAGRPAGASSLVEPPTPPPAWTATVHEYALPMAAGTSFSRVDGITAGPNGDLWAVQRVDVTQEEAAVDRVTIAGAVTQFVDPTTPTGDPGLITTGPDGALWYTTGPAYVGPPTYYTAPRIGRVTTAGAFSSFTTPGYPGTFSGPNGITAGPDGNLWFPDNLVRNIGSITTAGQFTVYPVPSGYNKWQITVGSDGNLWYTEGAIDAIGRITTSGVATDFPIPKAHLNPVVGNSTVGITSGRDGALWFTEPNTDEIGRLTTAGVFSFYPVPTTGSQPTGITTGADGNLWFTELASSRIGRLNPATGAVTEFRLPSFTAHPNAITTGSDGKIWFTENPDCSGPGCPAVASLDPATATPPPAPCLTVTTSTTLTADVGPCAGDGIDIAASNITLNLNGHRVFAAPGPRFGDFAGIRFQSVTSSTVEGGEVTGFDAGVLLDHGSANTASHLNVHDNIGALNSFDSLLGDGIVAMHSGGNQISDDTVNHNGVFDGIGILGIGSDRNTIEGNVIENNTGQGVDDGSGIVSNPFLEVENADRGMSLTGNNILENQVTANTGHGISNPSNTYSTIQGNTVTGNGMNGIGVSSLRFANVDTHDVVQRNWSSGNAGSGIQVASRSNRIVANMTNANGNYDLADLYQFVHRSGSCYNYWSDNSWGSGGYLTACVTVGGTGPNPPPGATTSTAASAADGGFLELSRGKTLPTR